MAFDRIKEQELQSELVALRREFHTYPETGWTEYRTTARIIEELESLGFAVSFGRAIHKTGERIGVPSEQTLEQCYTRAFGETNRHDLLQKMRGGYTGCIARLEGNLPGPTVMLRFDMDSNALEEAEDSNHRPTAEGFRSQHQGCMHACGHDAHIAIGIGTAKILSRYRDQLRGTVILIFQPAEEGLMGASSMVESGCFPKCDLFFSGHIGIHDLPLGTVAPSVRGMLASTKFDVRYHGASTHAGASPEEGRNALAAASTAVLNLLAIPRHSAGASRVNVGMMHAGTARNVVPGEAEICIETRGVTTSINEYMQNAAERVCTAAAEMYACTSEFIYRGKTDSITCDAQLAAFVEKALKELPAITQVLPHNEVFFGASEDVTAMMAQVQRQGGKATELLLGMPLIAPHHNDHFDIAEEILSLGAYTFATLVMNAGQEFAMPSED